MGNYKGDGYIGTVDINSNPYAGNQVFDEQTTINKVSPAITTGEIDSSTLDVDLQDEFDKETVEVVKQNNQIDPETLEILKRKGEEAKTLRTKWFLEPEYKTMLDEKTAKYRKEFSEKFGINNREEWIKFAVDRGVKVGSLPDWDTDSAIQGLEIEYNESLDKSYNRTKQLLTRPNSITQRLTKKLLNTGLSLTEINTLVTADEVINPATALFDSPYHFGLMQERFKEGKPLNAMGYLGLTSLDIIQSNVLVKSGGKFVKASKFALTGTKPIKTMAKAKEFQIAEAYRIQKATAEIARNNPKVKSLLIEGWETRTGFTISDTVKGLRVYNPEKAREAGKKKLNQLYEIEKDLKVDADGMPVQSDIILSAEQKLTRQADKSALNKISSGGSLGDEGALIVPFLNPDKLNGMVALLVDLKSIKIKNEKGKLVPKYPELQKMGAKKDEPLIDTIFNLTINKELLANKEVQELLIKHGVSFEDYVLTIVGSGSQAGQLLNQLSQIKRIRPKSELDAIEEKTLYSTQNLIYQLYGDSFIRAEGIRRGMMVSSLATAMRNATSAVIRSPVEGLANVMDNALLIKRAEGTGIIPNIVSGKAWRGAFSHMSYMLRQERAKEITDFILDHPQLGDQMNRLTGNYTEIAKARRGESIYGKGFDNTMNMLEEGSHFFNGPNRWQEFVIRRAMFLGEADRRFKQEWGIDLIKGLEEGKISLRDVLNDSPHLKPKDAPSALNIMDNSVTKAMDVTYAKQPDLAAFRSISNFITKSGLTAIIPFPRFMFNAMEFVAEHSVGATYPLIRRALSKDARGTPYTIKERQNVTRNLAAIPMMIGLVAYRRYGDAPADYKQVPSDLIIGDTQVDTSTLFPLRQALWIAEAVNRFFDGTLSSWGGTDKDEMLTVFAGTESLKTGTANVFIDEFASMLNAGNLDTFTDKAKRQKALGRIVGQYTNTYFTPIFQLTTAQRSSGVRTANYKDFTPEAEVVDVFKNAFRDSLSRRGLIAPSSEGDTVLRAGEGDPEIPTILSDEILSKGNEILTEEFNYIFRNKPRGSDNKPVISEEEKEMRNRVFITRTPDEERIGIPIRLTTGWAIGPEDNEERQFLIRIGYKDPDYQLGSKSDIGSIKDFENKQLRLLIPLTVRMAQKEFEKAGKVWEETDTFKTGEGKVSKKQYQALAAREYVEVQLAAYKGIISEAKQYVPEPIVKAIMDYRKIKKSSRLKAEQDWFLTNEEPPDLSKIEDIQFLVERAKVLSKAFQEALQD